MILCHHIKLKVLIVVIQQKLHATFQEQNLSAEWNKRISPLETFAQNMLP